MPMDEFEARLAKVRHRFAGSLESKLNDTMTAFAKLSVEVPDAPENVDQTYRRIHSICGVAPTVGFAATGRTARAAEVLLLAPMRDKRGLTQDESAAFKKAIGELWRAAHLELQAMYGRGG